MLIDILTQRSNAQRQMIAGAYQSMYGRVRLLHLDPLLGQVPEHQHPSQRNGPIIFLSLTFLNSMLVKNGLSCSYMFQGIGAYHEMYICMRYIHTVSTCAFPIHRACPK